MHWQQNKQRVYSLGSRISAAMEKNMLVPAYAKTMLETADTASRKEGFLKSW